MSAPVALPPPPALAAFLRGVERRGAVLAELQCGDAEAGDVALAAAMRSFRDGATAAPMGDWPRRFWAALLAQPQLRQRTPVALTLDATDTLDQLRAGPRAALLLRLAAGLSEAEAAAVLGVPEASYRLALRDALLRHPDGRADPQAWQRLRDQVHRRIKTLAPARLVRLSAAREAALHGTAPAAHAGAGTPARPAARPAAKPATAAAVRSRALRGLLWALLLVCALAFAATFWWPLGGPLTRLLGADLAGGWGGEVKVSALPPAEPPQAMLDPEAALVANRDFELLADPAGEAAAADLDFHAWLVAFDNGTAPTPAYDPEADAVALPPAPLPDAGLPPLESADGGGDHAL